MLRTQWKEEEEREKHNEQQKFLLNRERNLELINHNATEKELREHAEHLDRLRDKELLEAAMKRERDIENLEAAEKQALRNEIVELQKHYGQQAEDKAAYEKMIEQLVENENVKQWEAKEAQWRREDQARINLMKNVYQNREQDILLKQKLKEEGKWLQNYEKEQNDAEIMRQTLAHEEKAMTAAMNKKAHQTDVLRQVGERDRTMRRDLQDKMYEERAAKLAEIEYQRRINLEKQQNKTLLDTWKHTVGQH